MTGTIQLCQSPKVLSSRNGAHGPLDATPSITLHKRDNEAHCDQGVQAANG
jgi:hypothetical protein